MASFFTDLEEFRGYHDGTYFFINVGKYDTIKGAPLICRYSTKFTHINQALFVYVNFCDDDFKDLDMKHDGTFSVGKVISKQDLLSFIELYPHWFI